VSYLIARRRLLAGVAGAGLGLLLAACGAPSAHRHGQAGQGRPARAGAGQAQRERPVTLRLHARLGPEDDMWAQVLPKLEQAHNVKVQLEQVSGHVEYIQKLQTLAAGGQLGDVIHVFTGDSTFQIFAANGVLVSLDDFIAADRYDLGQYYKYCVESCKVDGKYYGLPFKAHPSRCGIFFNRDLFDAAGVKYPTNDSTYDDLVVHPPSMPYYSGILGRGCPLAFRVRPLSAEGTQTIEQLSRSRTAAARTVERARILRLAREGLTVPAIARERGVHAQTVRCWLTRFTEQGSAGLEDRPRPGRAPTDTPEEVSAVIAIRLTNPQDLGLPVASWTVDRLAASLNEERGSAIKRRRIDAILLAEGLRGRSQESWVGERVDPAVAEKRGGSPRSPRKHRRGVRSCVWTRGGQQAPRASPASRWSGRGPTRLASARWREPGRRPTMADGARATSSARSGRPPARRSLSPPRGGPPPTAQTSWRR